jgi:hypothetical protein
MVIETYLKLPTFVEFEGVIFELVIITKDRRGVNLCFAIRKARLGSPHLIDVEHYGSFMNPFQKGLCDFLWLRERIKSDEEMLSALRDVKAFIQCNAGINIVIS